MTEATPTPPATPRKRRTLVLLAIVPLAALIGINALAWSHARAMTQWVEGGARTANPEQLTAGERFRTLLLGVRVPRPTCTCDPSDLGLPFTREILERDQEPDLELWRVPLEDSRGTVLLVHGYAGAPDQLLDLVPPLRELGWGSALVALRGSCGSEGDGTTLGYREAEDVALAAGALDGPVVIYGFSMGSAASVRAVALELAAPEGLVLEACFDRLRSTVANRFGLMGLPAFPGADLLLLHGSLQAGFNAYTHDPVRYAAGVRQPTLVIGGEDDPRATAAEQRAVADALAGPSELVLVPGMAHAVTARKRPDLWQEVMGAFLEDLASPAHRR